MRSRPTSFGLFFCIAMSLSAMSAVAADIPGLAGHWKLDGNARDSATPAHDGQLNGRTEFFDSPIGGSGKLLWCNGVDSAVHVDQLPNWSAGDFTVSLWVCPLDLAATGIAGQGDMDHGWSIELAADHVIRFRVGAKEIDTIADRVGFGQWYHIAAGAQHGGKISLYVNGELAAETERGAGAGASDAPMTIGCASPKGPFFSGLIDDVRIFSRSITTDEVAKLTDAGLPWLRSKPRAKQPFAGHFSLEPDDVVTFVGGEDANAAQVAGYLETLLTAGSAGKHVLFRDMAWEGDTVFEQWRILNFGPWPRQFERVGASILFVQFGQMESLNGKQGLDAFISAYETLLDEFQKRTQRIVLVTPTPFQKSTASFPDLTSHNQDLKLYADAIRKLAEKRGLLCVDLFSTLQEIPLSHPLTRDGIHLTPYGQWIAARETARQIGLPSTDPVTDDNHPRFERRELEDIRVIAIEKNQLWTRYWRPTNWAFLNGDRISQPSSRDDVDRRIRWLPAEVQQYPAMIAGKEKKIAEVSKALEQR